MDDIKEKEMDTSYMERLIEFRNKSAIKRKRLKLAPIERGYTGHKMGGQSLGSPHPDYPEFDSRILELKVVATMTATKGRFRRFSALIATGNGEGVLGLGAAKSTSMRAAIRRARDRAFLNLLSYSIKENRTLYHTGHVKQWHSTIFAIPKMEGHGLVCHRVLATICRLVGIKDMYAKVEGSARNYKMVVQGFLKLLRQQKTYQEIADTYGLHVVEFTQDRDMYPNVLASPKTSNLIERIQESLMSAQPQDITLNGQPVKRVKPLTHPSQRSIMMVSNAPNYTKFKKPQDTSIFLDDLVDQIDDDEAEDVQTLLAEGERDLDTIMVFKGRVPRIKTKPRPFYWNLPGNVKRREENYRYRNREDVERERAAYKDLDAHFASQ
ncbi:28S ribosomal protein S5, mitochondrial [Cichlidogyrus casuarinus]|uniref:Small ribosomal subunit protein uS5m n=1 Tax=Cichlidogyrus casuarinus TaxID=1844966 RepID=A0ABD2QKV3_9PLAT